MAKGWVTQKHLEHYLIIPKYPSIGHKGLYVAKRASGVGYEPDVWVLGPLALHEEHSAKIGQQTNELTNHRSSDNLDLNPMRFGGATPCVPTTSQRTRAQGPKGRMNSRGFGSHSLRSVLAIFLDPTVVLLTCLEPCTCDACISIIHHTLISQTKGQSWRPLSLSETPQPRIGDYWGLLGGYWGQLVTSLPVHNVVWAKTRRVSTRRAHYAANASRRATLHLKVAFELHAWVSK